MARSVLIVEDDAAIRRGVVDALKFAGFQTWEAGRGDVGLEMAARNNYDLLLLDLVLPGGDGLKILREVRRTRPTVPVIILTARGDEADRVAGVQQGADDYVVKPFSVRELLARVEAVLRRSPARPIDVETAEIPGGVIDFARREVRFPTASASEAELQRFELSEREVELLRYLISNRGRAIPRDELLTSVWRISADGVSTRTIDMHVARLREKLRDDGENPHVLLTVRGVGYMFAGDATTGGGA